jgi:hypothetical protein
VPCLRASGEDHPFELGYCDSVLTIGILFVCLSIYLSVPNTLDSPEYTLKASDLQALLRFYKPRFFSLLLQ